MKLSNCIMIFGVIISLVSCDEVSSPLSINQIDWEGNYPLVNTAYLDSVLFSSDRAIGTSYIPSVHIMHKSGSGMHAITKEWFTTSASWSPRRWKIVFIADTGWGAPSYALYTMDYNGKNKKCISKAGEKVIGVPAWSPDGSKIAYEESNGVNARLKVMNPDGTDVQILTDWYLALTNKVSWSPDSKRIVFAKTDKLYTIHIDVDGERPSLLFDSKEQCIFPSWSPDGKYIAFCRASYVYEVAYIELFLYQITTKQIIELTHTKNFYHDVTWAPDSKSIMFSESPPGIDVGSSIYSMALDGSSRTQITDSHGYDYKVSWYK